MTTAVVDISNYHGGFEHLEHHSPAMTAAAQGRAALPDPYPLFIEPHVTQILPAIEESRQENSLASTLNHLSDPKDPARGILDKLRTIKLDTPALRRTHTLPHPPRTSSLNAPSNIHRMEPSAYAEMTHTLRGEPSAYATTTSALRHGRQDSLQQRRRVRGTNGSLTIQSPTARQARGGRPAGPMIWLPEEQVWLLTTNSEILAGGGPAATSSGVAYPHSAPLWQTTRVAAAAAAAAAPGVPPSDTRRGSEHDALEGPRLTRSDSSPIRSQFLNLIQPTYMSFHHPEWSRSRAQTGYSAIEEDAIWYAEQQARAAQRKDQDRFSPMLQQALVGVDLPGDVGRRRAGAHEGFLTLSPEDTSFVTSQPMRRASTDGDAGAAAAARRDVPRARVSTIGNEDHEAQFASLHLRDLLEQVPKRRHSDGEADSIGTGGGGAGAGAGAGAEESQHEWLASLIAQGIAPDALFSPQESVDNQGLRTPRRSESRSGESPKDGVSPMVGLSRSATMANNRSDGRGRWMSMSTDEGDERRPSVDLHDGEVSPISSRGRMSLASRAAGSLYGD